MTSTAALSAIAHLDRRGIQPWLPQLDEWLLPGNAYSVHHTWPQLYRSDGHGRFYAMFVGDRLVSHCATRIVTIHGEGGSFRAALLGSVATDPEFRGRGLAGQVLDEALATCRGEAEHVLLWAEREDLYARRGFAPGRLETCLLLARLPAIACEGVRPLELRDHPAIQGLHDKKPWRVARTASETSGLLTTPGMTTLVKERNGAVVAYACCGKGADLQDHWHEVGGNDADIAELVQTGMHRTEQTEAVVLCPPYRPGLRQALGRGVTAEFLVVGPMWLSFGDPLPACWIDGLDSV